MTVVKSLSVHQFSVVSFTFSVTVAVAVTASWEQSSTEPGARRRDGCRICLYLP